MVHAEAGLTRANDFLFSHVLFLWSQGVSFDFGDAAGLAPAVGFTGGITAFAG
jgi:hypothetical protein